MDNETTPQTPQTPPPQPPRPSISTLRTFKSDVSTAVSGQNVSMASMALSEARKKREQDTAVKSETNKTSIALVVSVILFVVSLGVMGYVVLFRSTPAEEVAVVKPRDSIIYADGHTAFAVDSYPRSQDLINALGQRLFDTDRRIGSIENIYFTKSAEQPYIDTDGTSKTRTVKQELTAQEFLTAIYSHAPDSFVRSISPTFMYGIHAFADNSGFLIFTTDSYESTYADLLAWEKRFLARDLAGILLQGGLSNGANEIDWKDEIHKNIDTRVLRGANNKIMLMYAFLNPTTLVITTSDEAFSEILSRYTTPKPVVQ